jgi:hypothetical protein
LQKRENGEKLCVRIIVMWREMVGFMWLETTENIQVLKESYMHCSLKQQLL